MPFQESFVKRGCPVERHAVPKLCFIYYLTLSQTHWTPCAKLFIPNSPSAITTHHLPTQSSLFHYADHPKFDFCLHLATSVVQSGFILLIAIPASPTWLLLPVIVKAGRLY